VRDFSIPVRFAREVLRHTEELGLDPIALLRKNRISPRLLLEESARLSVERFADLQVSTMLAMQDEALGYTTRRLPIGCWSMMCHAVIGSETLGQALSRYCRFFQLFDFGLHPHLSSAGEIARIRLLDADPCPQESGYFRDLTLFNAHRFASWLVQEHLPLQAVNLASSPVAEPADYRRMFLGNPVAFGQPASELLFSTALLDKRVVQSEQSLGHFLRHPVLMMLTQSFAGDSWTSRVRAQVRHSLDAMPALQEVAASLELHPQTLRRRLAAEGTSFKEIRNHMRRDTALHYLGKQGLSIEEIAHRAGFSESSAFIRAFKGWTGVTPYTYRKGL
jgi:AraC-like DNA-binding protein